MTRKLAFKDFVERATAAHSGKYTYPEQEYVNTKGKLRIICPDHGEFIQAAGHHMKGIGCRECANLKIAVSKVMPFKEFVSRSISAHGDRYSYDEKTYFGSEVKTRITCSIHGEFYQLPGSHYRGSGCVRCASSRNADKIRDTFGSFVEKANIAHNGRYEYPEQEYKGSSQKMDIKCSSHGIFKQVAETHVAGSGCPRCKGEQSANAKRATFADFVKKATSLHRGKYTYPAQPYIRRKEGLRIMCPAHGEFIQAAGVHLAGCGCPKCGYKNNGEHAKPFSNFVQKAHFVHSGRYTYPEQEYEGALSKVKIVCNLHGGFMQSASNHLQGSGCPACAKAGTSNGEIELSEIFAELGASAKYRVNIKDLDTTVQRSTGAPINSMELDVYFKSHNIALEYNGLYWHDEEHVGKKYHAGKTEACRELGIDLIQIFEDEWRLKPEIVKSIVNTRLGVYENRYYARKTKLITVSSATAGAFYDANHIQGKTPCNVNYGLAIGDEIVAMASFGNRSHLFKNNYDVELIRFCTKLNTQVVGGLSKLLALYNDVTVKTYCDLRLFNGGGYKAVGFEELHKSEPSYFYVKGAKRFSRFSFQKHKLEKVLATFDVNLSEAENMKHNGYFRVFDCGNLVMVRKPTISENSPV